MKLSYIHPADQLIMIMQRIYDKGLTTTSGGNLSILDDLGNIWITPAGIDKGTLTRKDIICVKPDDTVIGPHKPSSELPFHKSVYEMRKDIKAVLHAHPPALVAFSISRILPNLNLASCVQSVCKDIKMATYAVPGSTLLGKNIAMHFEKRTNMVMLENHGVCIGADSIFTAFNMFETLNYTAELEMIARRIGAPKQLPDDFKDKSSKRDTVELDEFVLGSHSPEELAARREMIAMIRRSYKQGLFTSNNGTYSVKLSDGSMLVTPHGYDRAYLEEDDLVLIKNGKKEKGKYPSTSVKLHQAIYDEHSDISSVILAQPVYTMAFAVTDAEMDSRTIPESYILLRDILKLPAEKSLECPKEIAKLFCNKTPILLFENNCAVVTGASMLQAFDRLEVLELTAHSIINTKQIGPIVPISDKEIDDIKVAFNLPD